MLTKSMTSRKKKNAVILAHNYQRPEIQDITDFIGDSLGLSIEASKTKADVIVFCGVDFMAETAKIINPEKKVLIPEQALCPMAMMLSPEQIREVKAKHPGVPVVLYVNTHAPARHSLTTHARLQTPLRSLARLNRIP